MSEAEEHELLRSGTRVTFRRGESMMHQGEQGAALFVLLSGCAKVTWTTLAGADTILALRGRGDLVGEFAVIDEMPRTASAMALNPISAVRVSRTAFLAYCAAHPAATRMIMQSLTRKIRQTTSFPPAGRSMDSRMRIARVLYDVAAEYGTRRANGSVVVPPLTQEDLAALAVVGTSTVERTLRELRDDGVVLTRYRQIIVLKMDVLGEWPAGFSCL